jgi:hypothetical protein
VLGYATSKAGALRVARRLPKLACEHHTARQVTIYNLEPENALPEGPAWAVGVAHGARGRRARA